MSDSRRGASARAMRRRPTEWDELVRTVLAAAPAPLTAYALTERLGGAANAVQPCQVYRVLDRLIARGEVQRLESNRSYALAAPAAIALVCRACGATAHGPALGIGCELHALACRAGFEPERIVLEAVGLCAACTGRSVIAPGAEADRPARCNLGAANPLTSRPDRLPPQ